MNGKSECISAGTYIDKLLKVTNLIYNENSGDPDDDGFYFGID